MSNASTQDSSEKIEPTQWIAQRLLQFKGRASASEFRRFIIAYFVVLFIAKLASNLFDQSDLAFCAFQVLIALPLFFIEARRWHDLGAPGGLVFVRHLPALILTGFVVAGLLPPVFSFIAIVAVIVLELVVTVVLMFKRGRDGDNKYGPTSPI